MLSLQLSAMPSIDRVHALLLVVVAVLLSVATAAGMAISRPYPKTFGGSGGTCSSTEPSFHQVLEKVGKTILRPGGSRATRTLHEWARFGSGDSLLELSAGVGRTSINVAERYGCHVVATDIDEARLEKCAARAADKGLGALVQTKKMDMFKLDSCLDKETRFDFVTAEASVTFHSLGKKKRFFQEVSEHGSKFLLHEMCFKHDDEEVQKTTKNDMSRTLNIGFYPETEATWRQLLEDVGYKIERVEIGDLALLNPSNLLEDEGLKGFARIVRNLATQPYLRSRVLAARRTIGRHWDDLGYIIICASKK